jgi:hypothetical protein
MSLEAARAFVARGKSVMAVNSLWTAHRRAAANGDVDALRAIDDVAGALEDQTPVADSVARLRDAVAASLGQAELRAVEQERAEAEAEQAVVESGLRELAKSRHGLGAATGRRFEYVVKAVPRQGVAETLAYAGHRGWELVAVIPDDPAEPTLYLKRESISPETSVREANVANARGRSAFAAVGFAEAGPDRDIDGDVDGGFGDSLRSLFE